MATAEDNPRRSHVATLKIGADTWEDVIAALHAVIQEQGRDGPSLTTVSGGATFGYVWEYDHDPDITHDSYFRAINNSKSTSPI